MIQEAIKDQNIPGAVLSVVHKGIEVCHRAYGNQVVFPKEEQMETNTRFDIASLTKVTAMLPVTLLLVDEGRLQLDTCVRDVFPTFPHERVTVRHLLNHTSGLGADHSLKYAGYTRPEIIKDLLEQPVHVDPGVKRVYSDLGMMLLYFLCEKILNNEFESYFYERVTQPLGMDCTSFNPKIKKNIAATEYDERHGTHKRGVVHDEKAEQMGGISGHAGLFSTARDLQKYLAIYENPRNEVLSKSLIEASFTGLGWQMSGQTFSHTGFTGVNMWCDPVEKLRVVFLTNRVHFGRSYNLTFLRKQIKEAIYKKIGGG